VAADVLHIVTSISVSPVNSKIVLSDLLLNIAVTDAENTAVVTPVDLRYEPGNVLRYGTNTTPGTTDMTIALQAACDSNEYVWYTENILISDVNVPAGVTIERFGGEISFVLGSTASGLDLQSGAKLINCHFDISGADSLGTSAAVDFEGDDCQVLNPYFDGKTAGAAANKMNYCIRFSATASNLRTRINGAEFVNTRFGIIRQTHTTGTMSWSRITNTRGTGINEGDLIEINLGTDTDIQIDGVIGEDIEGDTAGDGIIVGVAGDEGLGGAETSEIRRIQITRVTGSNSDKGVHVEGCNKILIDDITMSNISDATTEAAIQLYGCDDFTIGLHEINDCDAGIQVEAESTDQSSSGSIGVGHIKDCPIGIHIDCDTANSVVNITGANVKNSSSRGISVQGGGDYNITGCSTEDCVLGYRVDAESNSNSISFNGNTSTNDTTTHTLNNVASSSLYSSGNDFLGDFRPEIDFVADDVTPSVAAGNYFATVANTGATAITNFDGGRDGQRISVRGGSSTNASTIADSGNFRLTAAITLNQHTTIVLVQRAGVWIEDSRAVN